MRNFQYAEHKFQYARWLHSFPRAFPNSIFILPSLPFSLRRMVDSVIFVGFMLFIVASRAWNVTQEIEMSSQQRIEHMCTRDLCAKAKSKTHLRYWLFFCCWHILEIFAAESCLLHCESLRSSDFCLKYAEKNAAKRNIKISIFDVARRTASTAIP